jgi:hypothetical protein
LPFDAVSCPGSDELLLKDAIVGPTKLGDVHELVALGAFLPLPNVMEIVDQLFIDLLGQHLFDLAAPARRFTSLLGSAARSNATTLPASSNTGSRFSLIGQLTVDQPDDLCIFDTPGHDLADGIAGLRINTRRRLVDGLQNALAERSQ